MALTIEDTSVYLCGFEIKNMFTKVMKKGNQKQEGFMNPKKNLFARVVSILLIPAFFTSDAAFALAPISRTEAVDDSGRDRGDARTNAVAKDFTDAWAGAYGK